MLSSTDACARYDILPDSKEDPSMLRKSRFITLMVVVVVGLSACVAPPPRQRVVYRETDRSYDRSYDARDREYAERDRDYADRDEDADRYCRGCGTVRDVARVEIRQGNSGGGAVLGAVIGGLIGNQFGHGSGRAAATAAGVVGGAAVGNSVEENNARASSGNAWRFRVALDDGHWATVTQYDNPGFHPGDRVVIRGDHIEYARR
jgi:outer membrane lipoprotein SlyB